MGWNDVTGNKGIATTTLSLSVNAGDLIVVANYNGTVGETHSYSDTVNTYFKTANVSDGGNNNTISMAIAIAKTTATLTVTVSGLTPNNNSFCGGVYRHDSGSIPLDTIIAFADTGTTFTANGSGSSATDGDGPGNVRWATDFNCLLVSIIVDVTAGGDGVSPQFTVGTGFTNRTDRSTDDGGTNQQILHWEDREMPVLQVNNNAFDADPRATWTAKSTHGYVCCAILAHPPARPQQVPGMGHPKMSQRQNLQVGAFASV